MPRISKNDRFRNETLAILYGLRNSLDYRTFNAYNSQIRNKRIDAVRRIRNELTTNYLQNVVITYEYRETDNRYRQWRTRTVTLVVNGLKKNLKRLAKQAYEAEKYRIEQESPIITRNFSYTVQEPIAIQPVGQENIPMRREQPYILSGEVCQEWNTNKGKCVIDYLVHLWGDTKGIKKIMTEENLINEFQELWDYYYKFDKQNILEYGINIKLIHSFCQRHNLSYYALDEKNNCINNHISPNNNFKALLFRLLNGHIYPIIDEKKRKSIIGSIRNGEKRIISNDIEEKKKKKDEEKDERIVIYPTGKITGNDFILQQIQKHNKLPFPFNSSNISYSDGKFNYIVIDDKLILPDPINEINKHGEVIPTVQGLVKQYVEDNGKKYIGQNIQLLLQEIWKETYEEDLSNHSLQSTYNPVMYEFLTTENVKFRTHYGNTNMWLSDRPNDIVKWLDENPDRYDAVDLVKCYSSLLLNPLDNWIVYDILDEIEPYQPVDGDFPFGLYVVETDDLTILHQTNIYSNKILDYARENKVKFNVKYQILKKRKYESDNLENRNHFHKIINKIKSWNMDKKMMKLIINTITGYMGKTSLKKYNVSLNTNILEVFENGVIKNNDKSKEIYFEKMKDLFVYGNVDETEMVKNSLPVYIQILDWSNIMLHKMIKKMGGVCIYRHTDMAVCVLTNNEKTTADYTYNEIIPDDDITSSWGKTKQENPYHLKYKHFESYMKNNRHCKFPTLKTWKQYPYESSNQYEDIIKVAVEYGGLLLEGRAGTGKDYVIDKIPELDSDCKLALTNKASNLMNGTTIHKALGINNDDKACGVMMKKYKHKKIIVVNEISMINKALWFKLVLLKIKHPKLIFILSGDYRQCKPIEDERTDINDYDYFNSDIVKYLTNYNKVELTERQRYDFNMWIMLEDFYERGIIPDIPKGTPDFNAKKICYYNRTRKYINELCMNNLKTIDALFLYFEDDKDDPSHYKQQSVWIYNNLPVMSIKNNKDFDIVNGDEYFVKSFDEKNIILDNDIVIPVEKFHSNFVANYIATTHKLQGATIDEPLYIYDFDKLMTDKHLGYTALSRVKKIEYLFKI